MSEKENSKVPEEEYITEKEAKTFFSMFRKYWKEYKQKDPAMTNQEWLEQLLRREIPEMSEEEIKENAAEMVDSVQTFDENMTSLHEAAQHGTSKEHWLGKKLEEVPAGMSAQAYGAQLQEFDDLLAQANEKLADAVTRSADGHIKMSQNLDGNLAEELLAKTLEADAALQGKHLQVEVRNAHTKNSVDVRVKDLETGKWQNYQMKFGKDAKATIALIERGDYRNQRIVVPKEQLKEVQAHFPEKTITDHIDAFGAKGKSFAKQEMKELQQKLQENGEVPQLSYDDVSVKTLASNIGKNAGKFAIISAAVTTGINVIKKAWKGEKIEADEVMEEALKSGADAGVKTVAAGTLKVAVEKGVLRCIPKGTPVGVIATIATVGVENVKILAKAAKGEISKEKVLDQIGRTTVSMTAGLIAAGEAAAIGGVIGGPVGVVVGAVTGAVGYAAGSKYGEVVYDTWKKTATTAKKVIKTVVKGAKEAGRWFFNKVRRRRTGWLTV